MLTPYRRHLAGCPHRAKGQHFSLCKCPVWAYGTLPDGSPFRRSLQTNDWGRAERRVEILWTHGSDWLLPDPHQVRLTVAIDRFLTNCKARNLRPNTLTSYRNTLDHLREFCGATMVGAIDLPVLDHYRAGRTMAPNTWRKEIETLRAFFAWCIERGWCQRNPAKRIRMPRIDAPGTLPFDADEVARLIAACDRLEDDNIGKIEETRTRAKAIVYALLYSGLRISDLVRLERAALTGEHLSLRIMKTGVPLKLLLHADAVAALNALPEDGRYWLWSGGGEPETCAGNIRRTLNRLGKLAGKLHVHPHRFRDTFAVYLLSTGADMRTVQLLLGHTSIRTTEKHYAHFVAAHQLLLDAAVRKLQF